MAIDDNEDVTEAPILHAIRVALGREPGLVLWRISAGVTVDPGSGRRYRAGMVPGTADLIGILAPRGRWFALEVKSPTGRVSREQRLWGELVQSKGGYWAVVRSVEDARAALEDARR